MVGSAARPGSDLVSPRFLSKPGMTLALPIARLPQAAVFLKAFAQCSTNESCSVSRVLPMDLERKVYRDFAEMVFPLLK
jgi:hypothetical protein